MDAVRLGHIGAEVVVVGGLAYYLSTQLKQQQAQIDELKRQLAHVVVHVNNTQVDLRNELDKLASSLDAPPAAAPAVAQPATRRREPVRSDDSRSRKAASTTTSRPEVRTGARANARETLLNPPVEVRRTPVRTPARAAARTAVTELPLDEPSPPPKSPTPEPREVDEYEEDDVEAALNNTN